MRPGSGPGRCQRRWSCGFPSLPGVGRCRLGSRRMTTPAGRAGGQATRTVAGDVPAAGIRLWRGPGTRDRGRPVPPWVWAMISAVMETAVSSGVFEPVSPRCSRSRSSSEVRLSTVTVCWTPLTLRETRLSGGGRGRDERAPGRGGRRRLGSLFGTLLGGLFGWSECRLGGFCGHAHSLGWREVGRGTEWCRGPVCRCRSGGDSVMGGRRCLVEVVEVRPRKPHSQVSRPVIRAVRHPLCRTRRVSTSRRRWDDWGAYHCCWYVWR